MITRNPMQLKALIKNLAKLKGISAQLLMQNYMLERLLERISISQYQSYFILKGGFLIASIVGLDTRTTMDLDTTIKGLPLTLDTAQRFFTDICLISVDDDISFEVLDCSNIRETDDYNGIRVSLCATYLTMSVPLKVDVTTGDRITPSEIEYDFSLLFDERKIKILAYNIETILAEKLETILSRGIGNTRPRDFYDVYILYSLRKRKYRPNILRQALTETADKRGSSIILPQYKSILQRIEADTQMNLFWQKYCDDFSYARGIEFAKVCRVIIDLCAEIIIPSQ